MIHRMEVSSENPSAPALPVGNSDLPSDDPVQIREITGLGPVKAAISSSPFATGRGEYFQGSSTGVRNIVITLGLNPNWEDQTIASLRKLLYAYFMPEQWCKLRFFTDDYPVVDIEGIVEGFEPNIFTADPEIQVSVLCTKPDFVDPDPVLIEGIVPNALTDGVLSEYEFEYEGTAPTGFELRVTNTPSKDSYTGRIVIVNQSTHTYEVFDLNPVTIDDNHYLRLITTKTLRKISTIDNSGPDTNLLASMKAGSLWPELQPGDNIFSVGATESGLVFELIYYNCFGGL